MSATYMIEVYAPGASEDLLWTWEGDSPPMSFSEGDFLSLPKVPDSGLPTHVLQITKVEQILWTLQGELRHKVCLFTKKVENTPESRHGG